MRARKWIHNTFTLIIAAQFLLSLVAPASGYALAAEQPLPAALPRAGDSAPGISEVASSLAGAGPAAPAAPADTTLSVDILSSPWGALDHNSPEDMSTPHVFVIEARVSNTGGSAAEDVMVTLDYNDPVNGWVLLPGEDPQREVPSLGAGDSYYAYWFARYPSTIAASYTYTVTADADNASAVSTSDNYYGNPETGKTVKTRSYRSTGNSGLNQVSADIVVGVAFTITVKYDLGTGPEDITFSPTGDTGFDPSAYRLLNSQVRFYNDAGTWESTFYDRLFFDTLNASAENAEATFIFIALTPTDTSLCSYAAIGYTIPKYDQFYCSEKNGTIINISGEISLSMLKQASHITILQGETLTYTIQYSNSGDLPLTYAWVWDEVDTSIGSINTASIDPAYDPDWTTDSQVAWYIGDIGASGVPTSTGTTTFTITIDGNGLDLDDGAQLVNYAFFGVEPGSLPNNAALTSTFTTTVQAPVISIQKSDGLTNVEPGDTLTYTLQIQNSGSAAATNVVITDVLPAYVTPIGATTPVTDTQDGQTLVWNSLGPIAAGGGSLTIKIPVQVDIKAPNGEVLSNQATIQYSNLAGYVFETKSATDHTTVNAPLLSISKSDYPDPVLSGRSIEYTLNYANNGPAAATNVVITDVVPISTTFETGSCSPSCSVNGGVVTWSLGSIPANSNGSVSFSVLVDSDLETGALIYNDDYGIVSDQTDFYAGVAITTLVRKDAAFFDGYAFIDEDGDGIFDGGEGTLTGVTVTLDAATVPVTYTDSSGYYHFRVETEDPVMITAGEWPGYFRTTPGSVYLDSTLGVTQTVNFGYAPITSTFGVIYGAVYQDDNHDGSQDLGEQGLASVQISSAEAATSPVTTDGNGLYTLRFEASQSVTVTETNPTYYVSTTPDVIYASVTTGSDNGSPKNFGDFLGIKITGQVFDDADVDGAKDLGESGLAGADVAANGDSYTTLSSGVYTLYVALSGSGAVQIEETDPSGYVSTNAIPGTGMSRIDANTLEIGAPVSGAVYTGGDFGDVLTSGAITITGQVWNDNGAGSYLANGALDPGEPGLAGALISLSSGLTQTTGSDGVFSLYAPPNTIITVTETNPSGYVSTNAIPGDDLITSKVDNDTLVVSALSSGSTADGNLFGDVLPSSVAVVSGAVFDDENKNGVLDAGEAGLADVQVSMAIEGGATIAVMTGSDGNYQFAVAPGTDIRITSDGPGGSYLPTTPETIVLRPPAAGTFPGNNFGYGIYSEDVAVVYGIVFNDNNSDGDQDFGELGLGGAIVALNSTISTTTSSSGGLAGMFTFTVTHTLGEEVVYALHETNPSGYRSTTPDVINVPVEMNHSYYVEFGDTNNPNTASIYGTAFDDFSGDGVQDADEPGLPGVVISMTTGTGVLYATTKSYGQFTYGFIVTQPGFHTVSEQDPAKPGYRSTTPDKINVYVEQGRSYNVNFGDTNLGFATIIGVVYNDESGDGIQDPSELGIEGVTISLSTGATTTTREFGDYTFPIDTASLLRVIEIDPPGFHSTTPNTVTLAIDTSMTYQVDFGDSDAELLSSFFGTVFDDQNADGAWDLEPGLAGITVTINNGISYDYVTNYLGQYTFLIESPGAYTVTETDPAGWVSTNAIPGDPAVTKVDNNTLRVDVTLGTDYGENLFGDVQASQVFTVTGAVWDDNGAGVGGVRGDGLRNGTEPGLAGATVSLSSGMFQVTGADGSFTLHAPAGQPVTVTETNPSGYISTAAIAGNDASKVDLDTLVVNALSGGATSAGNLFGDVSPGSVAVITGVVFEDANGNGERDAGEAGISGVEITLDDTFTKTTETDGSYIFFTPTAGKHTLVETDKAGYFSTTPNQVQVEVELGESYQVDFGDKLIEGAEFASVYGTVFEDANGNGGQDDGELGIAGVTVTLDGGAAASTNLYGGYTFSTTLTGWHSVVETDPTGYFSTTPNEVLVEVESLGSGYQVDFGDKLIEGAEFASIYGMVFEDLNGSGERELGEPGIAGVTLTLDGGATTATDLYGNYTFSTTITGAHTVVETDLAGYFSTTPNEVHVNVESLGSDYQVDFGDAKTSAGFASIYGTVFEDANGNGGQDDGELGIAGVTVTLDGGAAASTNLYGGYTFSTTLTGWHSVVETDPTGYFSTTPNEVLVEVESLGSGYQVDFGDALIEEADFASIYGMVFEDLNGSGERELGEPGIAGVTLTLDGTKTTTTDEYGNYTFSTKQAGMHTVVETDPAGYFSTTPNEVHVTVALKSSKQVDFGDAPTSSNFAVIFGTVFEDSDEDTEWDAQEPGISGVTITLDGGATTTTNLYGGYTFSTTLTGAHTVVETDPDGYVSTTQNEVTVYDVAWGNGYEVNFGDTIECDCTKDAYEEDDIAAEAKEIQVGTAYSQTRNFCDDPTDWITFTVQANNVYTITTSSWGQRADTFLALFDTDGQTMLMANDDYEGATDFSARIIWRAALDGVYYIRVSNQAGLTRCNTDYDIWVDGVVSPFRYIYLPLVMKEVGSTTSAPEIFERSPAEVLAPLGVINHICPDVYEVDDTWEQAAAISPGVLQVHSFDSNPYLYAADKDLVWVEMMAGDTVTFTVGPVTGTLPLMELFDETGVSLGITGTQQISWTMPFSGDMFGRYYLSVSPQTPSFGCADVAGYGLTMEMFELNRVYLPLVVK